MCGTSFYLYIVEAYCFSETCYEKKKIYGTLKNVLGSILTMEKNGKLVEKHQISKST